DVVPAGDGWTRDPWSGDVDGGRLHGRGSLDMKAAVAGLAVAAASLRGLPLAGRIVVAAVADEEVGGHRGAGALVEGGLTADAAIVAEPGDGGVVVAHRGMCFLQLTTRGRSTHASMPHRGVNAIELM